MLDALLSGLTNSPNVHPVFVHFPVALWLVAAGAWLLWLFRRDESLWRFGRWSLRIGLLGAVAAIVSGYLAADAMGHHSPGHDLVHTHRDWMLWASGLALLTAIADHLVCRRLDRISRASLVVMGLVTAVVLIIGADRGGELVFRYSIGTAGEPLPASDGHDHEHADETHLDPHEPEPAAQDSPAAQQEPELIDQPSTQPARVHDAAPATPPGHEGHDHAH